jgi:23S rRNA pseudouridine1911/1915/1917 synthase
MQSIGHPLVGDKLYGPSAMLFQRAADGTLSERDRELLELERHALHSHRLSFTSPRSGRRVEVVSPLAPDLQAYLDRQRR